MRLFVAILFSDSVTEQLFRGLVSLRQQSIQGNFTRRENLHLTLAFLGETHQTEGAKRAIDAIVSPACSLSINRLGRFQRPGGDIMWVGIPGNPHLSALHQQLSSALREEGFSLEKREYRPHLTLGRQVLLDPSFHWKKWETQYLPIQTSVTKVSLMKSERIQGKLTYTELHHQLLS